MLYYFIHSHTYYQTKNDTMYYREMLHDFDALCGHYIKHCTSAYKCNYSKV